MVSMFEENVQSKNKKSEKSIILSLIIPITIICLKFYNLPIIVKRLYGTSKETILRGNITAGLGSPAKHLFLLSN